MSNEKYEKVLTHLGALRKGGASDPPGVAMGAGVVKLGAVLTKEGLRKSLEDADRATQARQVLASKVSKGTIPFTLEEKAPPTPTPLPYVPETSETQDKETDSLLTKVAGELDTLQHVTSDILQHLSEIGYPLMSGQGKPETDIWEGLKSRINKLASEEVPQLMGMIDGLKDQGFDRYLRLASLERAIHNVQQESYNYDQKLADLAHNVDSLRQEVLQELEHKLTKLVEDTANKLEGSAVSSEIAKEVTEGLSETDCVKQIFKRIAQCEEKLGATQLAGNMPQRLKDATNRLETLGVRMSSIRKRLDERLDNHSIKLESHSNRLDALEERVSSAESDINKRVTACEEGCTGLNTIARSCLDKVEALDIDVAKTMSGLSELSNQVASLRMKNEVTKEQDTSDFKETLDLLAEAHGQSMADVLSRLDVVSQLQGDHSARLGTLEHDHGQVRQACAKNTEGGIALSHAGKSTKAQIDRLRGVNERLERLLADYAEDIQDLRRVVEELQAKVASPCHAVPDCYGSPHWSPFNAACDDCTHFDACGEIYGSKMGVDPQYSEYKLVEEVTKEKTEDKQVIVIQDKKTSWLMVTFRIIEILLVLAALAAYLYPKI